MPAFIGRLILVGIGKESTRGDVIAPDFWLDKMNCTVENKFEVTVDDASIGRIEDSIDGKVTLEGAEGEISGKMFDKSFGLLLLAAIGSVDSTLKMGGTLTHFHTYSVKNDAQHPSLTITMDNPNQQLAFALAMIDSLEIRAEVGKYVEYTANFKSKKGATSTETPGFEVGENPFIAKHITLKVADKISDFSGVGAIPARSVTLRIVKNLERDDIFGSLDPSDILNKQFSVEATVVMLYSGLTFKTLYEAGDKQAMRIDIKNTDVDIEGSDKPELLIDLAQVLFTNWEKTTGNDDLVVQTITAKATYKKSEAMMLDCVLTNAVSSY